MLPDRFLNVHGFRRKLVLTGVAMLLISLLLFAGGLTGFYSLKAVMFTGQSVLKTIASLSVAGCLVAAIGYGNK
jgi:high-affinity Fe2+/Pb2+ permease